MYNVMHNLYNHIYYVPIISRIIVSLRLTEILKK